MVPVLIAVLVAAPGPVHRIAAPGLQSVSLDEKFTQSLLLHFTQQLTIHGGFQVTTPQEIGTLIGIQRQKQLLACSDDATNCVSEIANALGVDAVILGTISRVGSAFLANIKLVRAQDASTLAACSGRPRSEDELLNFLEACAKDFNARYGTKAPIGPPEAEVKSSTGGKTMAWVTGGLGIAGLAAGGTFLALSRSTEADLRVGKGANTIAELDAISSRGRTQEAVGYVLLGSGAAGLAASTFLFLSGSKASVAIIPSGAGAVICVGGTL